MILLDTNILSEVLKAKPSEAVMSWMAAQNSLGIFTTAVTQAEILYEIELLPAGKRRMGLSAAIAEMFAREFEGRIFPFDGEAAVWYAKIVAGRETAGRPISQFDAMIAAIARSRKAAVATRNTADFEGCGIRVVNPWAD